MDRPAVLHDHSVLHGLLLRTDARICPTADCHHSANGVPPADGADGWYARRGTTDAANADASADLSDLDLSDLDLSDLDESDCLGIGMKKLEVKRLMRA